MRIGIVPVLDQNAGGIYQYSLTLLRAIDQWKTEDRFVVVNLKNHPVPTYLQPGKWESRSLQTQKITTTALNGLRRVVGEGPHRQAWRKLRETLGQALDRSVPALPNPDVVRFRPELKQLFRDWKLDLILYAWPTPMSFECEIPYVMAIHDLQHRLQPEFPEVSANGEWEHREYCFRNGSRLATLLLADSEVGKEDILRYYGPHGVAPDRVKVLPFLPASYLNAEVPESERRRVRARYHLPERYLFYPAQFWPHKNHHRIVQSLSLLKEGRGLTVPIVFCGSHTGAIRERAFDDLMRLASGSGIENQIHYLGYVPDEDISGIYAQAAALVMPTFFGPTNIPILEAWAYSCPVLTSDIRGIREQVENAAVLVDPRSVEAIAQGIYRLWTDETLASNLADLGRRRLTAYTPDDFAERLIDILEEAKARTRFEHHQPASSLHALQ